MKEKFAFGIDCKSELLKKIEQRKWVLMHLAITIIRITTAYKLLMPNVFLAVWQLDKKLVERWSKSILTRIFAAHSTCHPAILFLFHKLNSVVIEEGVVPIIFVCFQFYCTLYFTIVENHLISFVFCLVKFILWSRTDGGYPQKVGNRRRWSMW